MHRLTVLLSAIALTGCASITGQSSQPMTVATLHNNQEVSGITCTLANDVGNWHLTTPGTVTIRKSTADLAVNCRRDSLAGNSNVVSKANTAVWGNILIGGLIGYVVDRNTGAGFDYPNSTTIVLRQLAVPGESAPAVSGLSNASSAVALSAPGAP